MRLYKSGLALKREGTDETVAAFVNNDHLAYVLTAIESYEPAKKCLLMGVTGDTPKFLHWLANRLVHVYGESENVDFVLSLRERANAMNEVLIEMGEL